MTAIQRRVVGAWRARAARREIRRRTRPGVPEGFAPLLGILAALAVIAVGGAYGAVLAFRWWLGG